MLAQELSYHLTFIINTCNYNWAGDIIGEMAFLDNGVSSATVVAAVESEIAMISYSSLRERTIEVRSLAGPLWKMIATIMVHRLFRTNATAASAAKRSGTMLVSSVVQAAHSDTNEG